MPIENYLATLGRAVGCLGNPGHPQAQPGEDLSLYARPCMPPHVTCKRVMSRQQRTYTSVLMHWHATMKHIIHGLLLPHNAVQPSARE